MTAPRVECLQEAAMLTAGDRQDTYGPPVENMHRVARIFNAITGYNLTAREAAYFLVALKLARQQTSPEHRDSYVDCAAYVGIAFECALDEAG